MEENVFNVPNIVVLPHIHEIFKFSNQKYDAKHPSPTRIIELPSQNITLEKRKNVSNYYHP